MKRTPRRAENRVASELNRFFAAQGLGPIQRKPVIGRSGPDYTSNEMRLVIDEKSRRSVPAIYDHLPEGISRFGDLIGVRLCDLGLLLTEADPSFSSPLSKTVQDWFDHMDEWRRDNLPDGITGLVIRKPGSWTKNACFLIREKDREVFCERSCPGA